MLFTKSIHAPISPLDGIRISVMSRHTLEDGVTPDSLITLDSYNCWLPSLAPPPKLIGGLYKRDLSWDAFTAQYLAHLQKPAVQATIGRLSRLALRTNLTLLCVEQNAAHCHRRLLAEECQRLTPQIYIEHH